MTALHHLATASPYIAALVVLLVIVSIGVLVWIALPEARGRDRHDDIDRQIASLRRHADHAVAHRPRVRANGCAATSDHIKATPKATLPTGVPVPDPAMFINVPQPCGGGQCRQRADCADVYCPGRLTASLLGGHRHARH